MAWRSNWINVATWGRKLVSQRAISLLLQISTLSLHYNFCSLMLSLEGLFSPVINCAPTSQRSAKTDVKNMRNNLLRWLKQIEGILRNDPWRNYFIKLTGILCLCNRMSSIHPCSIFITKVDNEIAIFKVLKLR